MLNKPPPLPEHELGINMDRAFSNIISKCRAMARLELWSVRLALEANDILSAQRALQRMDNINSLLLNDYELIAGLVWGAIEAMRANALSQIVACGLADEKWLCEQSELMLEKEQHIPLMHKRMIMGDASCMIETIDITESSTRGQFLFCPDYSRCFIGKGQRLQDVICSMTFRTCRRSPMQSLRECSPAVCALLARRKCQARLRRFGYHKG